MFKDLIFILSWSFN